MSDIPPTPTTSSNPNPQTPANPSPIPTTPASSDPNPTTAMDSNPNPTMATDSNPNHDPLRMRALCCRHCTNYIAVLPPGDFKFGIATYSLRVPRRTIPLFNHKYLVLAHLVNVHLGETYQNTARDIVCDFCKKVVGWRRIPNGPHFLLVACTMLLSRQGENNELQYSHIIVPPEDQTS